MARYLNPKSDLVFKKIFGEHPELLKSFLNAVLPLPSDGLIENLVYLPAENVPEIPNFKHSIVDVRCMDKQGRHFIVEMQLRWTDDFMKRMLFNSSAAYVRQLNRGQTYAKLCPVYGLSIVDAAFSNESNWFHHYLLMNAKDHTKTLDDIQLVFLELPKFKPNTIIEKKLTVLWLRFLTEITEETEQVDPALLATPEINEALQYAEIAAYTSGELRAYDAIWDAVSTERTFLSGTVKKALAEGEARGLALGEARGEARGLALGEAKGKAEENYKVAKNALAEGVDVQLVSKITSLSMEKVIEIKNTLNSEQ